MITMLLGGLWHGASWNFVLWGWLHGTGLALLRWRERILPPLVVPCLLRTPYAVAAGLFTFHYVCFAWIFFRAPSFGRASQVLHTLAAGSTFHPNLPTPVLLVLTLAAITHLIPDPSFEQAKQRFAGLPPFAQAFLLFGVAVVLHEAAGTASVPFVYFQF